MSFLQSLIDFHPFRLWLLCVAAVALLLRSRAPRARWFFQALPLICAASALVILLIRAVWYLKSPVYGWPLEPQLMSVSEIFRRGMPLYPSPEETGLLYSQVYGPASYLFYAAVFQVFGAGFAQAKIATFLVSLVAFQITATALYRRAPKSGPLLICLWAVWVSWFGIYAYGVRPDPLLLFGIAFALLSLNCRNRNGFILCALATALVINLKFSAALYLAPLFVLALFERGAKWTLGAGITGLALSFAPFLAPSISLPNFLTGLRSAANQPFLWGHLTGIGQTSLILALPCLISAWAARSRGARAWLPVATLLVCMAVTFMGTARLIAIQHHYMPYIPVALFLAARADWSLKTTSGRLLRLTSTATAMTFALITLFASYNRPDFQAMNRSETIARDCVRDLEKISAAHPGKRIHMAWGGGLVDIPDSAEFYRSALVFAGHPYVLEPTIAMEIGFRGVNPSSVAEKILEKQDIEIWVSPKGTAPFTGLSSYDHQPILNREFLEQFHRRFRLTSQEGAYDLWTAVLPPEQP